MLTTLEQQTQYFTPFLNDRKCNSYSLCFSITRYITTMLLLHNYLFYLIHYIRQDITRYITTMLLLHNYLFYLIDYIRQDKNNLSLFLIDWTFVCGCTQETLCCRCSRGPFSMEEFPIRQSYLDKNSEIFDS